MLLTQLTNSGSQHQNSSVFPLGSHLLLPLWSWVDTAVWSWEGTSCHRVFGMWRATVLPCWEHPWRFLKFAVTVILVIYFSVTPHPKTYWLKDDFIMGTSCLGNFCFPGWLVVFPSLSGRRIGLRGQCVFLSISGFLAGMEGRQVQLGQGAQHLLWSLKHLVL